MGNIYYDPPNGVHVAIPLSLRHHPDKDGFLGLLAQKAPQSLIDFATRLFSAETLTGAEISPVYELANLALAHNLADLAAEIGDLADEVGY